MAKSSRVPQVLRNIDHNVGSHSKFQMTSCHEFLQDHLSLEFLKGKIEPKESQKTPQKQKKITQTGSIP